MSPPQNKIGLMSILFVALVGMIFLSIQYESAFAASSTVIIPEGHMYWASCDKYKECFQPAVVTVNIGDEVVWQNQDSQTHTITSGYSSKGPDGNFDLIVKIGHSEKVRFDKPGIFPYFCIVHPWTGGKVVVNDIKVYSISMNVSPSSIFDGEKAVISGQVIASAPIARNTLVYEYETNTGISGSGWVDEGGSIRMNVFWPEGTHTITTSIKSTTGNFPTIFGNPVVLDIKSREPPKTTITLDPMREYGSTTDGLKEFTGKLTTQDGTPLSGKKITLKFEKQGSVETVFGYTDPSGRYSKPFDCKRREGDWTVYAVYEDGVNYRAAQSNKLFLTIQPVPIPAKTPEPVKTTPTTPEVKSSSATVNIQLLRDPFVYEGDTITVIGEVSKIDFSYVLVTVSDPNGNLILVNQVKVDTGRNFVIKIQTDNQYWSTSGQYTITAQYGNNDNTEVIQYTANKSAPTIPPSTSTSTNPSPTSVNSDVILTSGSSVPGCENSNFCFTPYVMNAKVGQTITWYNGDSAAHTVTSGVTYDGNSVGAVFDSGLFLAGDTFSHKFTSSGNVPYFCMVHPWMIGEVKVSGDSNNISSEPPIFSSSPGKLSDPMVVLTDSSSYSVGDIIQVYGQVKNKIKSYPVTLEIFDPNRKSLGTHDLPINKNHNFEVTFTDLENLGKTSGTYTVKVFYVTEFVKAETTFKFQKCGPSNSMPLWSGQMGKAPVDICTIPTTITLDPIPVSIYVGEKTVFTGKLTADGKPLENADVKIQTNILYDTMNEDLAIGTTDSNGRFEIPWTASSYFYKKHFKTNAVFDGDSAYETDQSLEQLMLVQKYGGSIKLDNLPASAQIGDSVIFSGTLTLENKSPKNKVVFIKDEDPANADDLLATATVYANGRFAANWFVKDVDFDKVADIYAVYEAEDASARLTTCDSQPTNDFGGGCKLTKSMKINPPTPPSNTYPPTPPPSSKFPPQEDGYRWNGDEYAVLKYVQPYNDGIHIGISPSPDSYSDAVRYIAPVKEGILLWTAKLGENGGNWRPTFEELEKGQTEWKKTPDIIINIISHEQNYWCDKDFGGWTLADQQKEGVSHNAWVCITSNKQPRSPESVAATTGHEFIHAVGLGHVWKKAGDLMCSKEMVSGQYTWTCPPPPPGQTKSKTPSRFDIFAAEVLYGNDGWNWPNNNNMISGEKYTVYDYFQ